MIGILDPRGLSPNPLNNNAFSPEYIKLAKFWSNLPTYAKASKIINSIENNQVNLVIAGTGSGKTVLLPKFALHAFGYKQKIAVTLPKQVVTKSAAEFAAKTLDVKLGNEVGYKYKGSAKEMYNETNKLLYATDGTIVAKLMKDPLLNEFNCVIIDEAHERKIQIDFLLYLLKNVLRQRSDFRLIIMSATINPDIFVNYFSEFSFNLINIGGKTNFPIESIFMKKPIKDYLKTGLKVIKHILKNHEGDILFFVTSSNEAKKVCEQISTDKVICIEVYSGMNKERQELAQDKDRYKKLGYKRKVVISTNVAESSLTIDGIKFVVECGYEFKSSYDPKLRAKVLNKEFISKAQAKQRMGRAGRTSKGICYHLYTKEQYDNMIDFPEPEIRSSDLTLDCLKLIEDTDINGLIKLFMDFIEPPKEAFILSALNKLKDLELIDTKITPLGKQVNKLFIEPELGISLVYAKQYNCHRIVSRLVALIISCKANLKKLFIVKPGFEKSMKKFKHKTGDHLSLYKIFEKYLKEYYKNDIDKLGKWAKKNHLRLNVLLRAHKLAKKLERNIDEMEYIEGLIDLDVNDDLLDKTLKCLNYGHRLNTGKYKINKMSYANKVGFFNDLNVIMGNKEANIVTNFVYYTQK